MMSVKERAQELGRIDAMVDAKEFSAGNSDLENSGGGPCVGAPCRPCGGPPPKCAPSPQPPRPCREL